MLVYLATFGAKLKIVDIGMVTNLIMFLAGVLVTLQRKKIFFNFALMLLGATFFIGIYFVLSGLGLSPNTAILTSNIKIFIYIFSVIGIVQVYRWIYRDKLYRVMLRDLRYSGIITCLLVVAFLFFPSLRLIIYPHLDLFILEKIRLSSSFEHRMVDLSMGGSTLSFALTLIFIEWRLYFQSTQRKESNFFFKFFVTALFGLAIFATSRSGMVIFLFYILCEFLFSDKSTRREILLTFVLASIPVTYFIMTYLNSEMVKWALEFFLKGIVEGRRDGNSLDNLLNQFPLPTDLYTWFFGFTDMPRTSDSFIINSLYSFGVPMLVIFFLYPVLINSRLDYLLILDRKAIYHRSLLISLVFIVANLKEFFWGDSRGAILILLLLLAIGNFHYREKEIE